MIKSIKRADGKFMSRELGGMDNLYFKCTVDDSAYAFIHIQTVGDIAYIHLNVTKFGKSVLAEMREDLERLTRKIKSYGINKMVGTHPVEGADKWAKFLGLVGFDIVLPCGDHIPGAMMTYKEV